MGTHRFFSLSLLGAVAVCTGAVLIARTNVASFVHCAQTDAACGAHLRSGDSFECPGARRASERTMKQYRDTVLFRECVAAVQRLRFRDLSRAQESAERVRIEAVRIGLPRFTAEAELAMGWAELDNKHIDSVEVHFNTALALATQIRDARLEGWALLGCAWCAERRADVQRGNRFLQRFEALPARARLPVQRAEGRLLLARLLSVAEKSGEALEPARVALDMYEQLRDSTGIVRSCLALATLVLSTPDAIPDSYAQRALTIAERRGDSCLAAEAHAVIGTIHGSQGRRQEAADAMMRGIDIAIRTNNKYVAAFTLGYLTQNHNRRNMPEKALLFIESALRYAQDLGLVLVSESLRIRKCSALWMLGRHEEALALQYETLRMMERTKDTINLIYAWAGIGHRHWELNKNDSARLAYSHALRLARAFQSDLHIMYALFVAGSFEHENGAYSQALRLLSECATYVERAPRDHHYHVLLNEVLAESYAGMKRWNEALVHYKKAVSDYSARKRFDWLMSGMCGLARTYHDAGVETGNAAHIDSAMQITRECIDLCIGQRSTFNLPELYHLAGRIHLLRGQHREALGELRTALAYTRDPAHTYRPAWILHTLGQALYRSGDVGAGLDTLRLALMLARGERHKLKLRDLLADLSAITAEQGQHAEAYGYLREAQALEDSITNAENLRIIGEMDARYKSVEKEHKIRELAQAQQLSQLEMARQGEELRKRTLEAERQKQDLVLLARQHDIQGLTLARQGDLLLIQALKVDSSRRAGMLLAERGRLQEAQLRNRGLTIQGLIAIVLFVAATAALFQRRIRNRQRESQLRADAAVLASRTAELQAHAAALQARAADTEVDRLTAETARREQQMQQEITRRFFEAQEQERKRISVDLHDSLGQELVVIRNRTLLAMEDASDPAAVRGQLAQVSEMTAKAMQTVREISHDLRPVELDRLGLTAALRSIVHQSQTAGMTMEVHLDPVDGLFDERGEILVYRICQEAVGNILHHAQSSRSELAVRHEDGSVGLIISDNGIGFNASAVHAAEPHAGGLGLESMRERVRMLGGLFDLDTDPGRGTTIRVTLPVTRGDGDEDGHPTIQ